MKGVILISSHAAYMKNIKTVKELLERSVTRYKDNVAFRIKKDNSYKEWTFTQVGDIINNLSVKLFSLGVEKGDRVAILSENRPEWSMSFLSISSMGATAVPLDSLLSIADNANNLKHSGAKGIIISGKFLDDLKNKRMNLPELKFIICMDLEEETSGILSFNELTKTSLGTKAKTEISPQDLNSIVYTSGTTGVSKGVMLSQKNIISNVLAIAELFPMICMDDNFLSVLPLHHTFETTVGFLCPFYMGSTITYAESLKSYAILANMRETGVTIMLGVPLLYRLFLDGIMREVSEKGLVVRILFRILFFLSKLFRTVFKLNIGRKLFSMIHKKLGGKIRFWVSGAAAIDPEVISSFELMGITILQGYGLTESSPVLSCCTLKNNNVGSVGKPVPGVEIKIYDGQVIARGPSIMQGYYKMLEKTKETIKDGWLYTGDIGHLDKNNYLFITGRSKDVIVTGSGLNVYPEEIELELSKSKAVSECCVLGRKVKQGIRKGMEEVIAVIIPNKEFIEKCSKERKIKADKQFIMSLLRAEAHKINKKSPEHKRIADIILREKEFQKTSTKKIKRFVLRKELENGKS